MVGTHGFTAGDMCSIPGLGTKILQAAQCGQKKKNNNANNK